MRRNAPRIFPAAAVGLVLFLFSVSSLSAQQGPDALALYRQGRDLESAGNTKDAEERYNQSIAVCDAELAADPTRMDAYVVKCFCLLRVSRYPEVISEGQKALKLKNDYRIVEVMGEAYYFLNDNDSTLKYLQKYLDAVPETEERVSTAYFYMGETYLRLKKYSHADIAYTLAVYKEPSMARWWYRLGLARENAGEYAASAEAYQKAASLSPSMKEAKEGLSRMNAKIASQ
jgi:tetratricopeptide (TPR) repeat protein